MFLATAYNAIVESGSFKATNQCAFTRVMDIMNTKSSKTFRWSVRLIGDSWVYTGIASKLEQRRAWIEDYDENSIIFYPYMSKICKGTKESPSNITNVKSGDEIHFRFQPKFKKFSVSLVSFIIRCWK